MRPFTISIEPRTLEQLRQLAEASGISTSTLIREILEDFTDTKCQESDKNCEALPYLAQLILTAQAK